MPRPIHRTRSLKVQARGPVLPGGYAACIALESFVISGQYCADPESDQVGSCSQTRDTA